MNNGLYFSFNKFRIVDALLYPKASAICLIVALLEYVARNVFNDLCADIAQTI